MKHFIDMVLVLYTFAEMVHKNLFIDFIYFSMLPLSWRILAGFIYILLLFHTIIYIWMQVIKLPEHQY